MAFITDNQTLADLNLIGKPGEASIYTLFNHTATRGGASLLEEMFRFPLSDSEAINQRSAAIQYFSQLKAFPFDSQLFDIVEQYLENTDERTKLSESEEGFVKKLSNLVVDDPNYAFVYQGVTALKELLNGFRTFVAQHPAVASSFNAELGSSNRLLAEEAFVALLNENTNGKISFSKVAEYDRIVRFRERNAIKKILRHLYLIDVYISVGGIATQREFAFPVALPKGTHRTTLNGVYHPQVSKAVTNNLDFTPDKNIVFLTGANMAGKSTFMKSLGIAVYLAHMGFPVAATAMEFSVLDGMYTTINLPDDLGMGASHFYAEVLRLKKVAKELSLAKNLFVMFDELFRGTNVKDAQEATIAIVDAFASKPHSMFVVSTHIIEAGEVLKTYCKPIRFTYLPTRMKQDSPEYTYKLENGITADRHGMLIINQAGIIDILKSRKSQ